MGRLIDVDMLMEKLNVFNDKVNGNEHFINGIETAKELLDDMPTAYDTEKVVEQLQQQANQYNRRALELVEKSTEAGIHNKGKACSYEHAIEIVRKGGAE